MSKETENFDLAESKALNIPVVMWRFCAYKNEEDYIKGEFYFIKDFFDHGDMKEFSSNHSYRSKKHNTNYCSMYWKIETNAT